MKPGTPLSFGPTGQQLLAEKHSCSRRWRHTTQSEHGKKTKTKAANINIRILSDIVLVYIWGQSGTRFTNLIYLIFGFVHKYRMPSKWRFNKEKNMIKPNGEMCEIGPEIESSTAEQCGTSIIIQKCNRPRPHFITCHD
jgi:hypothetical protein